MNFEKVGERMNLAVEPSQQVIFGMTAVATLTVAATEGNRQFAPDSDDLQILKLATGLCMFPDDRQSVPFVSASAELIQDMATALRTQVIPTLPQSFHRLANELADELEVAGIVASDSSGVIRNRRDYDRARVALTAMLEDAIEGKS